MPMWPWLASPSEAFCRFSPSPAAAVSRTLGSWLALAGWVKVLEELDARGRLQADGFYLFETDVKDPEDSPRGVARVRLRTELVIYSSDAQRQSGFVHVLACHALALVPTPQGVVRPRLRGISSSHSFASGAVSGWCCRAVGREGLSLLTLPILGMWYGAPSLAFQAPILRT